MLDKNIPVVTISVTTYNSSKYVIETLESIKAQSYPNLNLQISDDCSTDNTIEVCKKWIEENKARFVKTKIIVPEHNTGVSGNCNRAWDACETTYYKGIAGDDMLAPNCITDNMNYVEQHPEAIFVFSKVKTFGANSEQNERINKLFDYSAFSLTIEKQLERMTHAHNFIPASTAFVNLEKVRELKLRHDERIPNLEDMPKWVNALKLGVHFHFMDIVTVNYRVHQKSLSTSTMLSPSYMKQLELFWYYYTFADLYRNDSKKAVESAVDRNIKLYATKYEILTSRRFMLFVRIINILKKCRIIH